MLLKTTVPKVLLRKLPLETFVKGSRSRMLPKKYRGKVPLKTTISECCSKNYHSKSSSKISVGECCWKKCLESVARNNCTQMLLKKPPLETFFKTIRSRKLSKNVLRISATNNNRAEVLLKKPPLQMFVRTIRSRLPPKSVSRKSVAKNHRTEMLNCSSKNCRSKCSSKIAVTECGWKSTKKKSH